jgi:hypothetical protein
LLRAEEAVAVSGERPCYEERPEFLQGARGRSVAASGGRPCYKALPELLQRGLPELLLGVGGGRELPAADSLATKGCRTCCKAWPDLLRGAGSVALMGRRLAPMARDRDKAEGAAGDGVAGRSRKCS